MDALAHAFDKDIPGSVAATPWLRSPAMRSLERILAAAAGRPSSLFVFDQASGCMSPVSAGAPARGVAITKLLRDYPRGIPAGTPGFQDAVESSSLLLPLTGPSGLEGALLIGRRESPACPQLKELQELCSAGASVIAGLRRKNQMCGTVAAAAHDLGTPLATARGFARLLKAEADELSDLHREYLATVLLNLERAVQVLPALRAGAEE